MEINIVILKFVFVFFLVELLLLFLLRGKKLDFFYREFFYFVLFILISNKFIITHSKKELDNNQLSITYSSSCSSFTNQKNAVTQKIQHDIALKFVWLNACLCFFIMFLLSITILLTIDLGIYNLLSTLLGGVFKMILGDKVIKKLLTSMSSNISISQYIKSIYSGQITNICRVFSNKFITMFSIQTLICLINEYRNINLINALNMYTITLYSFLYFSKEIFSFQPKFVKNNIRFYYLYLIISFLLKITVFPATIHLLKI